VFHQSLIILGGIQTSTTSGECHEANHSHCFKTLIKTTRINLF
jgi:hypothetical protein